MFESAQKGQEEDLDVSFVLGDGSKMWGHRWVMCKGSEIFNVCFTTGMLESHGEPIILKGCSREILVRLLEYIYIGEVEKQISPDCWKHVLDLGRMWQVSGLRNYFVKNVDAETVCR